MTPKEFASIVLQAMLNHENSYDHEAAREVTENEHHPDYKRFYKLNYEQAAELVCQQRSIDKAWAQPIYLLMIAVWNDIADWATELTTEPNE